MVVTAVATVEEASHNNQLGWRQRCRCATTRTPSHALQALGELELLPYSWWRHWWHPHEHDVQKSWPNTQSKRDPSQHDGRICRWNAQDHPSLGVRAYSPPPGALSSNSSHSNAHRCHITLSRARRNLCTVHAQPCPCRRNKEWWILSASSTQHQRTHRWCSNQPSRRCPWWHPTMLPPSNRTMPPISNSSRDISDR